MLVKLKMLKSNQFFLFFLGCYSLLALTIDAKTYLIPFLICVFGLLFYFRLTLSQSLFLLLIFSLPFENTIRQWLYEVTPPIFVGNPFSGYQFYSGITLKLIFSITLFFILLSQSKTLPYLKPFRLHHYFLLLFLLGGATISLFFHSPSSISLLGLLRLWQTTAIFFFGYLFFSQKKIREIFISLILALITFTVCLSLIQIMNRGALGRWLEIRPSFSDSGFYTTDGQKQYRTSSYISHPVYYGSFLSLLIPIAVGVMIYFFQQKSKQKTLFLLVLNIASAISLVGTLSRSTWITLPTIILLFIRHQYFQLSKIFSSFLVFLKKRYILFLLPIIVLLAISINQTLIRFQTFSQIFSYFGNASIRIELLKQSIVMIRNNPLTGVGLNQFTSTLVTQDIHPNIQGLIFPVHNTFFIFLTELGLPIGIFFILFVIFSLKENYRKSKQNPINLGIWIGCLTFIISAQFHPLFIYDPTLEMFMLLTSYLSTARD